MLHRRGTRVVPLRYGEYLAANAPGAVFVELDGADQPPFTEGTDVIADVALYAPFALLPPFSGFGIAAVITFAIIAELAGVMGPMIGASRRYDGPFGKCDRAFAFGALGLWAGLGGPLPESLQLILPLFVLLLIATIVNRVQSALSEKSTVGR